MRYRNLIEIRSGMKAEAYLEKITKPDYILTPADEEIIQLMVGEGVQSGTPGSDPLQTLMKTLNDILG